MDKVNDFRQLEKKYQAHLKAIIVSESIFPIKLIGGKDNPTNSVDLSDGIAYFLSNEKWVDKKGWTIKWKNIKVNKKTEEWPAQIFIETEEDLLFLLKKEKEMAKFKQILQQLVAWNPAIQEGLVRYSNDIIQKEKAWKDICMVVDHLLLHDVSEYYLRNLPISVHSKFMEQHKSIIISFLKHLAPERFTSESKDLSEVLGLKLKQHLFPVKWLDDALAKTYNIDLEIMGISLSGLQELDNNVKEIWLVENETNLYLVPKRKNALAICSRGFAVNLLKGIPLFEKVKLLYWGDLDMHGFTILHQCRAIYQHVTSVMMDVETITFHQSEYQLIDVKIICSNLPLLHPHEMEAFERLYPNGRIEQEKLNQEYISQYIKQLASMV
jgi:hypothetical protein